MMNYGSSPTYDDKTTQNVAIASYPQNEFDAIFSDDTLKGLRLEVDCENIVGRNEPGDYINGRHSLPHSFHPHQHQQQLRRYPYATERVIPRPMVTSLPVTAALNDTARQKQQQHPHINREHLPQQLEQEYTGRSLAEKRPLFKYRSRIIDDDRWSYSNDSSPNGSVSSNEMRYPRDGRTMTRGGNQAASLQGPVNYFGISPNSANYLPYQQHGPIVQTEIGMVAHPTAVPNVFAFLMPPNGMYQELRGVCAPVSRDPNTDAFYGGFQSAVPLPNNLKTTPATPAPSPVTTAAMMSFPCHANVPKFDRNNATLRQQPQPMGWPHITQIPVDVAQTVPPTMIPNHPHGVVTSGQHHPSYWSGSTKSSSATTSDDIQRGLFVAHPAVTQVQSIEPQNNNNNNINQQSQAVATPNAFYGPQFIRPLPTTFDPPRRPPVVTSNNNTVANVTGTMMDSISSNPIKSDETTMKSNIDDVKRRRMNVIRPALLKINRKANHNLQEGFNDKSLIESVVIYWMIRELRTVHNHSLSYAQQVANENRIPLVVLYSPYHTPYPNKRQAYWRIRGLVDVQTELQRCNIPLFSEMSSDWVVMKQMLRNFDVVSIITDHFPLKEIKVYKEQILEFLPHTTAFVEVDSHNVVPCWVASLKRESQPRTFRRNHRTGRATFKLQDLPPKLEVHQFLFRGLGKFSHINDCILECKDAVHKLMTFPLPLLETDKDVHEIKWAKPGQMEGLKIVHEWCTKGILGYSKNRSDPHAQNTSKMSIYLNHGFISAQYCLCEMEKYNVASKADKDRFINQILTWKELSDNLTYYNPDYDTIKVFPKWAITSLKYHEKDTRQWLYTYEELEKCQTYDEVWNSCQKELIMFGVMNPSLRLFWAKKIVEWTENITVALDYSTRLNNKWALDGTDPSSYNGIAWSIGGTFDRGFECRNIYGRVRCASIRGVDLEKWVDKINQAWTLYPTESEKETGKWMELFKKDTNTRSIPLDLELVERPDTVQGCQCMDTSTDSAENAQS